VKQKQDDKIRDIKHNTALAGMIQTVSTIEYTRTQITNKR